MLEHGDMASSGDSHVLIPVSGLLSMALALQRLITAGRQRQGRTRKKQAQVDMK